MKKLIIIGAGGNSKVILDILKARRKQLFEDIQLLGFLDDNINSIPPENFPLLGSLKKLNDYIHNNEVTVINGIGSNAVRKSVYEAYKNINWYTAIHPSAIISSNVIIGDGAVVMPGAIINSGASIGKLALINTGAIVEHDNNIGDFTHLASGVTTAGNVTVGELTMLGTGSKVIQGITIGTNTMIGAGAIVINDIPSDCTAVGTPAKVINTK